MQISLSSRPSHRLSPHKRSAFVARRSETACLLGRDLCCLIALSTPYAMFLLNGAVHP
jgi:hypothetical protein